MQKILLLSLIITLLSSCSLLQIKETNNTNSWTIVSSENIENIELSEEEKKAKKAEEKKEKIANLRKKLALRWLIIKWDINLKNKEYTSALVKYLQIHKEIPNDQATIQKLWDVYFNMKKFKQAYWYYNEIKDYERLGRDKAAIALISSMILNEENILKINNELDTLWLSKDQLFYYKNSISCKTDFSLCKLNFQNYFNENIKTKSWTWESIEKIQFEELYNIETALTNYENFQVDDLLYKWALVSWAFFENWLFPIAIETSKIVLEEKEDYKPLLKLIAKSYYELWNYIEAKLYLIKYNKLIKKDDPEASYFLWVVYERLHEYILSTIHFKKALKTWYENKLDVNKRILFNYYELWEIEKMLESFKIIINENKEDIISDDYNLAIYYNIVNEKMDDAKNYTIEALKKYPESEIFNWYMWWILMEEINSKPEVEQLDWEEINLYIEAEKYIDIGLELNPKNPMLTLVKWKLEMSKWDARKAFIYFKKTVSLDNSWDFWKIAKQELEGIEINR